MDRGPTRFCGVHREWVWISIEGIGFRIAGMDFGMNGFGFQLKGMDFHTAVNGYGFGFRREWN